MSPRPIDVIALPMGEFTFPPGEEYEGQTGLVVAYAIRHATGTFLFDTGFAMPDPELDSFYLRYDVRPSSLPEVASAAGLDLAEVTAVANCHLHLDHAGQNTLFPGVPIFVQGPEWDVAHEPDYTIPPGDRLPGRELPAPRRAITRSRRASASSRRPATRPATSRWWWRRLTARCCSSARRSTATANGQEPRARAKARARRATSPHTPVRWPG